ncbi:MAG: hypothetical protein QM778_33215 [Myxococcales bacterium]
MTTTAEIQYLTRQIYGKYKEKELFFEAPLSDYAKKTYDFQGSDKEIPIDAILGGGVASTAANAVLQHTSVQGKKFKVPQCTMIGHIKFESKVLRNSKGDAKFIDYAKKCVLDGTQKLYQEIELLGFGDGTGARATVLAASGSTITIAPYQAQYFSIGQLIGASATPGSALVSGTPIAYNGVVDPAGTARVIGVNTTTGVLTVNGTVTSQITGIGTPGMSLYHYGIASNNGAENIMTGLNGWNPLVVSATLFMNVDRTLNINAMGGSRFIASSGVPRQAVFVRARAQAKTDLPNLWKEGGAAFMHPIQWAAYEELLESLKMFDADVSDTEMGIRKLKYRGNTLTESRHCPLNTSWVVGPDAAELSLGQSRPYATDAFDDPQGNYVMQKIAHDGGWIFTPTRLQRIEMPTLVG